MTPGSSPSTSGPRPRIRSVLTMFYYRDIDRAARWYQSTLGFEVVRTIDNSVLFELFDGSLLVLVGDGQGSQRPIPGTNKGAILSFEIDDLEAWHATMLAENVEGAADGLHIGANGRTLEFKLRDPEGYTVEFFRWL